MIPGKILSQNLVTVWRDDSFRFIKEVFDQGRIHHLLVEDQKQRYGVIADRDFWQAVSIFNRPRMS